MSKKLMMNNSENGLMPVMKGLVCWLDGRDGKTGDTIWKDRSGNGNDAVFKNNKTIFENGKLTLNGDNYAELPFGNSEPLNKYTFHAYAKKPSTATSKDMLVSYDLTLGTSKYICLRYPKGMTNYASGATSGTIQIDNTEYNNLLLNVFQDKAQFYVNAKLSITINKQGDTITNSNIMIGSNRYNDNRYWFSGNIATILIYDRPLTEEEIQQNYLYERSIERGE